MFSGSYLGRHAAKHRSIDKKSKIHGSPLFHMFCYVFLFPDPFRSGILIIGVWYVSWISHDFSWTCPGKSPVHSVSHYCTCSSQNMRKTRQHIACPYLNPWTSLKTTENYAPFFRVRAHRFPPLNQSKSFPWGYGSIPINTIFSGMNIHLPAILMFTRGTRFWHTAWESSRCPVPFPNGRSDPYMGNRAAIDWRETWGRYSKGGNVRMLPSGYDWHSHGKSPFLIGKPSINGSFSMAMLNNQMLHDFTVKMEIWNIKHGEFLPHIYQTLGFSRFKMGASPAGIILTIKKYGIFQPSNISSENP